MAQQTAVEWLIEQMIKEISKHISIEITPRGSELIEQAKEMEKEQIVNAWMDIDTDFERKCAEQYYNETYGK
jgi:HSP90 family molecular chaperone